MPLLRQENSLAGFQDAFEAGLHGLERDLQQTADGVLVLSHDQLLRGEPISSMTWSAAKRKACWLVRLEESIERHHAAGRYVVTWLINDRELGRRHLEWGADGIVGDEHVELPRSRA